MPILRNVADEVPARWPPSENCAAAGRAARATTSRASSGAMRFLEVIVEGQSPDRAGSVVRGVVGAIDHLASALEIDHVVAGPDRNSLAGGGVDALDDPVVEDIVADQAQIEAPA